MDLGKPLISRTTVLQALEYVGMQLPLSLAVIQAAPITFKVQIFK